MPIRADLTLQSEGATFASVGQRLRELRTARGISVRALAKSASVDKNTVLRVESGQAVSLKILNRMCAALSTVLPQVTAPLPEASEVSVFHASSDNFRIMLNTLTSRSGLPDYTQIADPKERKRLGDLGFVTGFMQSHECSITNGTLQAAVMEIHSAWSKPASHPGEEFLMCLLGEVLVTVGDKPNLLAQGDSITFRSDLVHNFEPAASNPNNIVPKILMVWIEGASGVEGLPTR